MVMGAAAKIGQPRIERGVRATLWRIVGRRLFRWSFHNWYLLRAALLRVFGARVHRTARIRPTVRISQPWRLSVGRQTAIGDWSVIDCSEGVRIGDYCTISQYAQLCAVDGASAAGQCGDHGPITIEDRAWIAADVWIGPGVVIGHDAVVGARSTVFESVEPDVIAAGDHAHAIGPRRPVEASPRSNA